MHDPKIYAAVLALGWTGLTLLGALIVLLWGPVILNLIT